MGHLKLSVILILTALCYTTQAADGCPNGSLRFEDNCYYFPFREEWGDFSYSNSVCANSDGVMATFPTEQHYYFLRDIWSTFEIDSSKAWIGLQHFNDDWYWKSGEASNPQSFWHDDEYDQFEMEPCGAGWYNHDMGLGWSSEECEQRLPVICMKRVDPCVEMSCPHMSHCVETSAGAECLCDRGTTPVHENGNLIGCLSQGVCQGSGDPHYTLWDGKKAHYQGICRHMLARLCENTTSSLQAFEVIVYNDRLPNRPFVSYTFYVEIHVYGWIIKFGPGNSQQISPPVLPAPIYFPLGGLSQFIAISPYGNGHQLLTDFGLRVRFSNYAVTVNIPSTYKDHMCGICGNFNDDADDDPITNLEQFMLPPDNADPECETEDPYNDPPCDAAVQQAAEDKCNELKTLSFLTDCLDALGLTSQQVESFYDDCVMDICATGNVTLVLEIFCYTVDAVVEVCNDMGYSIHVNYRDEVQCPMDCDEYAVYNPNMSLDIPTCCNPDGVYYPSNGFGEGCECKDGYIMHNGECILKDECGCYLPDEQGHIERNQSVINENCTLEYYCPPVGALQVTSYRCGINADCRRSSDIYDCACDYECYCPTGTTGDPLHECNDDTIGNGDPHFMLTSHISNDHFCFDAHGPTGTIWRLIKDESVGLVVNAKLFEGEDSTLENPTSYFSDISILSGDDSILFTRDNIIVNGHEHPWGKQIDNKLLNQINSIMYEVKIKEDVVISVIRAKHSYDGHYLGIYVKHGEGMSSQTTGILGQFIKKQFYIQNRIDRPRLTRATMVFEDNSHDPVDTILTQRFNQIHRGVVSCWFYRKPTGSKDDLLGDMEQYELHSIVDY